MVEKERKRDESKKRTEGKREAKKTSFFRERKEGKRRRAGEGGGVGENVYVWLLLCMLWVGWDF